MQKKGLVYGLAGLGLFILAFGVAYLVGGKLLKPDSEVNTPSTTQSKLANAKKPAFDPALPRTEVCPLNGQLYPKVARDIWETRSPLAVMIENHVDARPLSGLGSADIVYEAIAEGGITRQMGIFYCGATAGNITVAPVRSARIYFVNLVSEYNALYTHVGGAGNCDDPNVDPRAKALCAINRFNVKNLDQMGKAGAFNVCHRISGRLDHDVAYEHTMACFTDELYKAGAKWGWTNVDENKVPWDKNFVSWKFKSASEKSTGSPATTVSYMFWASNREFNKAYDDQWDYDQATNSYKRTNGGQVAVDLNTGDPLMFNNVVVQLTKETFLSDIENHLLYDVIGQGKAFVFQDGVAISATWTKTTRTSRTVYKDVTTSKEIKFNPGPIWISIVPSGNTVTYQ